MRSRKVTYSREAAFHALADPTRRAVLDMLRRGSHPAGQIARTFPISRPAISRHLRLLRRAHLVQERREANLTSLKAFVEAEHAHETKGGKTH